MLVQDPVTLETDVTKEVAGLLVAETFNSFFADEPVAPLERVTETVKLASQPQIAMGEQEFARMLDISRPRVRVSVNPGKCLRKLETRSGQKKWPHRLDRPNSHPGGAAAGKETKDHFLEEVAVVAVPPDGFEFGQPSPDLRTPVGVRAFYVFKR